MKRVWNIWQRLSRRERSLVVATLGIFILVLGRYFVLAPYIERREWVKGQLEIQPQLLEKNLRFIGQKTEIVAGLKKARAELKAVEPALLSGDTPSVSASDLQQTVQGLAAKEGTQIVSTRVMNPEVIGSFTRIPIQLEINGQIDQVTNLIKGIESTDRLLVINDINIRSLLTPAVTQRRPEVSPPAAQSLRVSLIVSGFTRSRAPAPAKGEAAAGRSKVDEGKSPAKSAPKL